MKRKVKFTIIILISATLLFIWYDQSRSFFKATNGQYITMWKRLGGTCYLIPGKYYGVKKPNVSYVLTNNNSGGDFIWNDKNSKSIIFYGNKSDKIINNNNSSIIINNYLDDRSKNDSLYMIKKGSYSFFRNKLIRLKINILENYSINELGEKQK